MSSGSTSYKNEKNLKCKPRGKFFRRYDNLKKVDINNEKNCKSIGLPEKCLITWFGAVFMFQVTWIRLYWQTGCQAGAGPGPNLRLRHVPMNLGTF